MNLGPLACEASALTTELTARRHLLKYQKRPLAVRAPLRLYDQGRNAAHVLRCGNDRARTCDLALMKRPLYH